MAVLQPPPTFTDPVRVDETTGRARFSEIWLKWFVDLAALINPTGLGTVTSVAASFTGGLVSVGGSPITTAGTLAFTVAGTSGGVPYFSSATTWASSGVLTNHAVVLGGGAAAAPYTISVGASNTYLKGSTGADPAFSAITLASADFANQGTTVTVLHGNGSGNPSFSPVRLTADVSGILPLANGGTGTDGTFNSFTTTRTGWVDVGSPTVTARYTIAGHVCFFEIKVVPATTTATTAGTSYCSLPVAAAAASITGDASMTDLTTFISVGNCVIDKTNSRVYVPTQGATADSVVLAGWYEV